MLKMDDFLCQIGNLRHPYVMMSTNYQRLFIITTLTSPKYINCALIVFLQYQSIQLINLLRKMRGIKEPYQSGTPIKKWQQMSPLEDDLAIIQSEESSIHEIELFNSLIGQATTQKELSLSQIHSSSEEQQSQSSSLSLSHELFIQSAQSLSATAIKGSEQKISEIELKVVDSNRKGCNCKYSKCQKNYCDCLRMGLICAEGVCSCKDCHNMELSHLHKEKTMMVLKMQSQTIRGCNCRKSKCLKKYCQCHSNGRKCGSLCQCMDCSNRDENDYKSYQSLRKLRKATNVSDMNSIYH